MPQDLLHAEFVLTGANGRPFGLDITAPFQAREQQLPIVLFLHGFKGFKDWGHFPLIAQDAANQGFIFVKYNLSHNGVSPEAPLDFVDLEAFGHNTYAFELHDTQVVIDWLFGDSVDNNGKALSATGIKCDMPAYYFVGHSRGGGIAVLQAAKDLRIKGLATWAGVGDLVERFPAELREVIRKEGVYYIYNSRTKQQMPLYSDILNDLEKNALDYDLSSAIGRLKIPYLVVHGDADETVAVADAMRLVTANEAVTKLLVIPDGDHTFGGRHPYDNDKLPTTMQGVLNETLAFFKSCK